MTATFNKTQKQRKEALSVTVRCCVVCRAFLAFLACICFSPTLETTADAYSHSGGVMETIFKLFRFIKLLSLSYCLFWVPTNAGLNILSAAVGSTVHLLCKNESLGSLNQLTWAKNKTKIVTFSLLKHETDWNHDAYSLQMNMSKSQEKLYALTIERVLKDHAGNYTCVTTTGTGVLEEEWMLIITDKEDAENNKSRPPMLIIIVTAICIGVMLVVFLIIFLCRHHRHNNIQPAATEMVNTVYQLRSNEKIQDIYENCLERQVCQSHHIYSN